MRIKLIIFSLIFVLEGVVSSSQAAKAAEIEQVILVHGLGRSGSSMWLIESRLQDLGYQTCSVNYGSRKFSIARLVSDLKVQIGNCHKIASDKSKINFVTHSMGGPLLRAYLRHNPLENIGRVVMLSPPNKGTPLVELTNDVNPMFFKKLIGPTAVELHSGQKSWLRTLPKPDYEVGVIGGNITFNPFAAYILPGEDDGVVPVGHMRIDGMKDFTTVRATHVTIRYSKSALNEISSFLRTGKFGK